ncbi:hypothetical protein B0I35DRAFT_498765 [Stachybotrys elegans]|uniref:DUF7025 domain-containing protein n=1 Tax=Stachybotrys elegans TaxID=80388 RepID=A0A8K0SFG3_9HYPO|nr:hypothetical protein B0I35DRAFT_498765 [Stachybotrys elegans]
MQYDDILDHMSTATSEISSLKHSSSPGRSPPPMQPHHEKHHRAFHDSDEGEKSVDQSGFDENVRGNDKKQLQPLIKCEVKEYVSRFNLKGEEVLREVDDKKKDKNQPDTEDDKTLASVYHHREQLTKHMMALEDVTARFDLLDFAARELKEETERFSTQVTNSSTPAVMYSDLWMLFKAGDLAVLGGESQQRIVRIVSCKYVPSELFKVDHWLITESFGYDGKSFGYVESQLEITAFPATRLVSHLDIYPFKFHKSMEKLQEKQIIRGKRELVEIPRKRNKS